MDTKTKSFRRRFERKVREAVGFEFPSLRKASSLLQEVGNLPTWVYCPSRSCFGLGHPRGCLDGALENQKEGKEKLNFFFLVFRYDVQFSRLILGLVWDGFCAMFMADLWFQLGWVCRRLKGLFLR